MLRGEFAVGKGDCETRSSGMEMLRAEMESVK